MFCKMIEHGLSSIQYWSLFIIWNYLYQSGYYSYFIKVGLVCSENVLEVTLNYLIYALRVVQKLWLCEKLLYEKCDGKQKLCMFAF